MTARNRIILKLAAVALAIGGGLLAVSPASAQDSLITIESVTITPGGATTLGLSVEGVVSPGLAAWNIAILYDPAIVSALACTSPPDRICNPSFAPGEVHIAGAVAPGIVGDSHLATITMACDTEGISDLVIQVNEFHDGTQGDPLPIPFKLQNGTIVCAAELPPLLGDADCNGLVNSRDALLVLQLEAALIASVPCPDLADVNQDGVINSVDAGLIKQIDAGLLIL